ncbi:MAG TPA: proton-conducting transporter membrane subunit, partial [Anaerolinea sp.]|nr:proton-conducting transporter membrane subunit [Anaerolinea sp.]
MPVSILSGIGLAIGSAWIFRALKHRAALLLALLVFLAFGFFGFLIPQIASGTQLHLSIPWAPNFGLAFSFHLDGLSLLFSVLILGIGGLVVVYGGEYLKDHPALPRFFSLIMLFMSAMLGLVLSGNALLLFLFWELTSISSFFLIGFDHARPTARAAAWQALLVTGAGSLAMLAGFVLMFVISGSFELQDWIQSASAIQQHALAPAAFVLILIGAMTKSAQFPFHFWLPNAMEAPTPVSAYLHSATMVKAGVYLLARLYPVFGGMAIWSALIPIGLVTLLAGALLALGQTDLKRLLAYTTVGALGGLVFLLGLGNSLAIKTAMAFLFAHALYKGALFLVAGAVDHAVHSRDIRELGGMAKGMPFTAVAAGLAALSMAGLPPFLGFISKELVYESALDAGRLPLLLTGSVVVAMLAMVAVAGWVGYTPFWAKPSRAFSSHEGPTALWLPPLTLAILGLAAGIFPQLTANAMIGPSVDALLLASQKIKLALWHGFTPYLLISLLTILLGGVVFLARRRLQPWIARIWHYLQVIGPDRLYQEGLKSTLSFNVKLTRILQSGYLRVYVLIIVATTVVLIMLTAVTRLGAFPLRLGAMPRFYDVILVGIIVVAAIQVTRTRSRLATIAMLGAVGYSIAILFLLYSAPDLAMVQFAIETLTVILFILIIYRLPKFTQLSHPIPRLFDVAVALAGGVLMTFLMLLVSSQTTSSHLGDFFAQNSYVQAFGRNVVNVILVDFRGFDTLGEISVLAIAAIGVYALINFIEKKP